MAKKKISSDLKTSASDRAKKLKDVRVPRSWVAVIVIIGILGVGLITYILFPDLYKGTDSEKDQDLETLKLSLEELLPTVDCDQYIDNAEIISAAVNEKDMVICGCIEEEDSSEKCITKTSDASLLLQASSQCNPELCDKITNGVTRENCKEGVEKYITILDPVQLATCSLGSGDYDRSLIEYKAALQENPDNTIYMVGLATAYINKALFEHKEDEYIPMAEELLAKAENLEPDNPKIYYAKGFAYEVKPDYVMALENYNKALELNPDYIDAYVGRGHTSNLMGVLDKALEDFLSAKELDKDQSRMEIYNQICRLASTNSQKFDLAMESCKIVSDSDTSIAIYKLEANIVLGNLYLINEDFENSLLYYKQGEAINDQDTNLLTEMSRYYVASQDYDKSLEYSQKAIEIDGNKAAAYLWMAQAYYFKDEASNGDYSMSMEKAEKGLEVLPNDVSLVGLNKNPVKKNLYLTLADCYQKLGQNDKEQEYRNLANELFN